MNGKLHCDKGQRYMVIKYQEKNSDNFLQNTCCIVYFPVIYCDTEQ